MKIYTNLFMATDNKTLSFEVKIKRSVFDGFFFQDNDMRQYECGAMFEGMPYNCFIDLSNVAKSVKLLPFVIEDAQYVFVDNQNMEPEKPTTFEQLLDACKEKSFSYEVPEVVKATDKVWTIVAATPQLESLFSWHTLYETMAEIMNIDCME